MKNLKMGKKFAVTFGIIFILFSVVIFAAVNSLIGNGKKFTNFYEDGHQIVSQTMEMRRLIQSAAKNVGYSTMTMNVQKTNEYIDAAQQNMEDLKKGITFLKEHFKQDASLIAQLEQTLQESEKSREDVYALARKNKSLQAADIYFKEYNPYLLTVSNFLTQINDIASEEAEKNYTVAKATEAFTLVLVIILSIVSLTVTIILSLYITKSVTRPLKKIEAAAKEMAEGSLKVNISYHSRDELGMLSESMRILGNGLANIVNDMSSVLGEMAKGNFKVDTNAEQNYIGDYLPILGAMRHISQSLSSALSQINEAADQVAGGSDQVASGAQALSQGATEQASSIEQLAATIDEISTHVKTTAQNAQAAKVVSLEASEEVTISNAKMQEMIFAMQNINVKSDEISKIIKTIEDIAFQTNILALNAAVEAARAGQAGKGFAVVADEVRNLANNSSEAANSTTTLIEESMQAVQTGVQVANEAAMSMTRVVEGSAQIDELIEKIAIASNEQSESIAQVTVGVDQISSVVQTNSATAEQSAAASEQLSGQAQMLKSLVGKFEFQNAGYAINENDDIYYDTTRYQFEQSEQGKY